MEISKSEVMAIQEVVGQAEQVVVQLQNLELSLVGGGCGDISLG